MLIASVTGLAIIVVAILLAIFYIVFDGEVYEIGRKRREKRRAALITELNKIYNIPDEEDSDECVDNPIVECSNCGFRTTCLCRERDGSSEEDSEASREPSLGKGCYR